MQETVIMNVQTGIMTFITTDFDVLDPMQVGRVITSLVSPEEQGSGKPD